MKDSMPRRSPGNAGPTPGAMPPAGLLVAFISVLLICTSVGCGGPPPEQGVAPLGTETRDDPSETVPEKDRVTAGDSASAKISEGPGNPTDTDAETAHEQVTDLLERFDDAISALHAEPLAAADDNHPLSRAWLEVVVGGSQLDRQVRGRIEVSGTDDNMAVVPDAEGTSFRNVALQVTRQPDGSLAWVNCGYAPGVGIDLDTGEVLDDNRTSTRGRGEAVAGPDGRFMVSELWDDESRLLQPGEPDPCAADTAEHSADRDGSGR